MNPIKSNMPELRITFLPKRKIMRWVLDVLAFAILASLILVFIIFSIKIGVGWAVLTGIGIGVPLVWALHRVVEWFN